jgi:hypothetical protein
MTLYSGNVQTYGLLAHDIKRNQCHAKGTNENRVNLYANT